MELRWTTAIGLVQPRTVASTCYNVSFGQQPGLNPALQRIEVNLEATSLGTGKYYMVKLTNIWGATNPFNSSRGA